MEQLRSQIDTGSAEFGERRAAMESAGREPSQSDRRRPRRRTGPRAARGAEEDVRARSRGQAARLRLAVPGAVGAGGARALRRRGARRRPRDRDRTRFRPRGHGRRQRRDGQRWHLLSDDGQEASASAGDRRAEPAGLRLPRRLRRRVSSSPGGGVPGPGPLRAHLLQPGANVGQAHPAGRRRDGLLHRGRRLRAGDVGRGGDRQRRRNDFSRGARLS